MGAPGFVTWEWGVFICFLIESGLMSCKPPVLASHCVLLLHCTPSFTAAKSFPFPVRLRSTSISGFQLRKFLQNEYLELIISISLPVYLNWKRFINFCFPEYQMLHSTRIILTGSIMLFNWIFRTWWHLNVCFITNLKHFPKACFTQSTVPSAEAPVSISYLTMTSLYSS